MNTWIDVMLVSGAVAAAAVYLVRGAFRKKKAGGCHSNSSCGGGCRSGLGKKG